MLAARNCLSSGITRPHVEQRSVIQPNILVFPLFRMMFPEPWHDRASGIGGLGSRIGGAELFWERKSGGQPATRIKGKER